jgi:hypothetical protein
MFSPLYKWVSTTPAAASVPKRTSDLIRRFFPVAALDLYLDRPALEAIFHLPGNDGSFREEQHRFLAAQGARRPAVMLAFPPKAAGTFLRAAAVKATGGEVLRVCYAQGDRDAQLYLPTFLAYYAGGFCTGPMVTHVHMQAFPANIAFLEAFGIRPIVMVRSIPDMLASYWDMLEDGGSDLPMGINCTIPPDFRTMPAEDRAAFMIDVIAPWYAGYYATWCAYAAAHPARLAILHYGDFVREPAQTLARLLAFSGLERSLEQCKQAIEAVWAERHLHRFSEGVLGRGRDYFSASQIQRIDKLLSYYPGTAALHAELMGL